MVELAQVAFTRGEVSPLAADRTDQAFYASALAACQNFFVRAEGAVTNRPGLEFIGQCGSNTPLGSFLLPFVYNNGQSYIAEFAAGSIALYADGAPVSAGAGVDISGITFQPVIVNHVVIGAQVTVVTTSAHGFEPGQQVTISGVSSTGSFNPNGTWTVASPIPASTSFVFYAPAISAFSYTSGGVATGPNAITNPYQLADLPNLRWAQSADVLNVTVATQPPYELTRLATDSFSYAAMNLLFGPFQDTNTDGTTTVYASASSGTVTLTASAPIFQPAHVGALFYLEEQYLSSIQPWTAEQTVATDGAGVATALCRSDGKIYVAVGPTGAGNTITGTFQPVHTSGTQWDGNGTAPSTGVQSGVEWQYVSSNAGVAEITEYVDAYHVKAQVQTYEGIASAFPPTVVGGPQTIEGPWSFSGDGSTATFGPLTGATSADPNQFYVSVGGIFQDPSTYSLSGPTSGSIVFVTPPPAGTNNVVIAQVVGTTSTVYMVNGESGVSAMKGLCLSTYWAFGSFSTLQGYPACVCYYNDRLVFGGTQLQPQTLFTSQVSGYVNFGVSDPQIDSDAITATLNSRQQNPIVDLMPLNNLLIGTASGTLRVTDTSGIGAITPTDISVLPQEFYGVQDIPTVLTGSTVIYAQWGGRKIRDVVYQFMYDKFLGQELTTFARQIFPVGTTCTRMAFAPEPYGLLFCVRSDGVLCVCTYLPEQSLIAWSRYTTAGNFEDVQVVPENGTFAVYVIVGRTINGAYVRYIERFAAREYTDVDDAFFVDSGLTYDGRNGSSTTMTLTGGSTWLAQDSGTLTASSASGWAGFQATDVGNQIWLYDADENRCRVQIGSVASTTNAAVKFLDPVPSDLQASPRSTWTFAKANLSGLTNLPGQSVAIFADGAVQPSVTVSSAGTLTLANPGGVVHAGLPYTCQLQGMNLNIQGQESIRQYAKRIERLSIVIDESYGFLVGPDFDHMDPLPLREFEPMGQSLVPHTGVVHCRLPADWSDDATVCVEGRDPVPITILGWRASVEIGEAG